MESNFSKDKRDRLADYLYSYWSNNTDERKRSFNYVRNHIKDQIKSIELTNEETIIHVKDGRKFYWDPDSYDSLNGFIRIGNWEPESAHIMKSLIKEGDCVFDVGANFGWYTTLFANYTGNEGEVHSFEPLRHMNSELRANTQLNNNQNVTVNETGLEEFNSTQKFYYPKTRGSMFSSLRKHSNNSDYLEYRCKFITMDSYIKEKKINDVNFVKLDVEGAEFLVLKGARDLLGSANAPILSMEVSRALSSSFEYTLQDLDDFLKQFNYYCFIVSNDHKLKPISSLTELGTANIFCLQMKHILQYNSLFE